MKLNLECCYLTEKPNLRCTLPNQADLVTRTLPGLSQPIPLTCQPPSSVPPPSPPPLFPSNPFPLHYQLSLRVKALKRQVDESEGEVERLEGVRRKVLRDLEEQQELREALHAKVSALENELK